MSKSSEPPELFDPKFEDSMVRIDNFRNDPYPKGPLNHYTLPGMYTKAQVSLFHEANVRTFDQLAGIIFLLERDEDSFLHWLINVVNLESLFASELAYEMIKKLSQF